MKKSISFFAIGLILFFISISLVSQAQVDRNAATQKKLENGITLAKNNLAKNQKMLATSDSLIETGTKQVNDSKVEVKAIAVERKKLDKDYATAKKPLDKLSGSKDKTEVTQARADLKALDTKYRADIKALDNRERLAAKNSTTGSANLNRGKSNKKIAEDGIKTAQASLDEAQAKYDAFTKPAEDNTLVKKKK